MTVRIPSILLLLAATVACSCQGTAKPAPGTGAPPQVAIHPTSASLAVSGAQQFAATPAVTVDWSVALAPSTDAPVFPLALSASHRYLVDQNGRPWRIQADAGWLATALSPSQVDTYLADRVAKGFDAFYFMSMVHPGDFSPYAPRAAANYNGDTPFTTGGTTPGAGDFANPNPAYWSYVDTIIDKAAAQGMAVMFAFNYLGYTGSSQGWYAEIGAMSTAQATAWGTFLGNRYKGRSNIIWFGAGDFRPAAGSQLETNVVATIDAIKAAGATQLWMAELQAPDDVPSLDSTAITAAADGSGTAMMNSFYGYGPSSNYDVYRTADAAYRASPVRPAWMQEGTYEGEDNMSIGLGDRVWSTRRGRFWSVLAGGSAGDGFGSGQVWTLRNFPASLGSPGSVQSSYAFALLGAIPWWDLRPSGTGTGFAGRTLVASGNGSCSGGDLSCIASSVTGDGTRLLAYVPGTDGGSAARTFSVDLGALSAPARASWWNPRTGASTPIGAAAYGNGGTQSFTTPGSNGGGNDWVLVLDAAGTASCGTISSTGLYTAPASVPADVSCRVRVALHSDPAITAEATITVHP